MPFPLAHHRQSAWKNLAGGVLFLAIAVLGTFELIVVAELDIRYDQSLDPGPALLPLIILGCLAVGGITMCCVALLSFGSVARQQTDTASQPILAQSLYASVLVASLLLLPILTTRYGLLPASMLFIFPWLMWMNSRRSRWLPALLSSALSSLLICLCIYSVFVLMLNIPL